MIDRLSDREIDVLEQIERGETYKETAAALGVAVTTVQVYVDRCVRKFGVRDIREAVRIFRTLRENWDARVGRLPAAK